MNGTENMRPVDHLSDEEIVPGLRVYADRLVRWATVVEVGSNGGWIRWDRPLNGVWESRMQWRALWTPIEK